MDRPCRDGADRAERRYRRLTSSFSWRPSSSSPSCHPPPVPRVPRLVTAAGILGRVRRPVKGKIQWAGSRRSLGRYTLGTRRSVSLASGRGATMLATLHEFLVEGDALLAHGTLLGRIRREIPAHEAEDLLAGDLGLLRPAPQGADANDLPAQLLHEIAQELDRGPGADEIFDDQHLGGGSDEPVELGGEGDLALAGGDALRAVHEGGPGGMRARHAVGEDEGAGARGEHDVDGPLGEVLGDDRPQPLGGGGFRGHERLLDELARVLARGQEDVVVGVIGARPLQDLQMDLLANLCVHPGSFLRGRRGHGIVRITAPAHPCQSLKMMTENVAVRAEGPRPEARAEWNVRAE